MRNPLTAQEQCPPDPQERLARLALYLGLNLNPAAFHRVIRHVGSAVEAFEGRDLSVLRVNLSPLLSAGLFEEAGQRLDQAADKGLKIMVWGDPDYPERLLEIPDPPPVLWLKGSLEAADKNAVALVGSRAASAAGLKSSARLGREGARMGLTIVSGLAKGIDAQAHLGALEAGGRTLAVLGNGLDWVYPRENARLYERVAASGALISEFPPETRPHPANFPRRNRVVAGLSLAVVVVEAGQRSGALITARLALELNRELMALPGPAGSADARGANRLIKDGAALVEDMAEVLAEIKPRLLEGLCPLPQISAAEEPPDPTPESPGRPEPNPPAPTPPKPPRPEGPEGRVLELLADGPRDADQLTRATGLSVAEMSLLLLNLELAGLVARLDSGLYKEVE